MSEFPRSKKEYRALVFAEYRRRQRWKKAGIFEGIFLAVALTDLFEAHAPPHETHATFQGDCANIRMEVSADKRRAKVILPPGCHYTNSD